jgi:signal peptidase complex subunit 1
MSTKPGLFKSLKEGKMDFVGQHKAQRFYTIVLWVAGLVGFVYGFATQSFLKSFAVLFAAFLVCGIIVVPSWPYFNKNRLQFQRASKGKSE